jgi:hypothetical protein
MAGTLTVDTIQSDSSYASTLNVASKMNFAAGMQIGGQDTTFGGMRNRIINGDMRIDQRNAGASYSAVDSTYGLDRWKLASYDSSAQTGKYTVIQSSTAPTGFPTSMLITSSAATTINASSIYWVGQMIEGFNTADLGFGAAGASTVTVSFWVRSSLTGTFGGVLSNSASNRSYPFSYTINSANTFEFKTVTIPGDTSGTWLTTNGIGIRLIFNLGSGTTYQGTAGAWSGSQLNSVTGTTSLLATNGATLYIAGVQLEKGSAASAFENRQYGQELVLCQRYYEKTGINQRQFWTANAQMTTKPYSYKATKRGTPAITITNAYTVDGWTSYTVEAHGGSVSGGYDILNTVGISATSSGGSNTIAIIACQLEISAEL